MLRGQRITNLLGWENTVNKDHLTRQLDLLPVELLGKKIVVIGAGAIGSFTVLNLVKMGFYNVTVHDMDVVSVENMNCQWYRHSDIGKPKVVALREIIQDFTGTEISIVNKRWEGAPLEGIVISAVDSMEVRTKIWGACKENVFVPWVIDPRMASEYALLYVMDPCDSEDIASYEKTLYTDAQGVQEPCTSKAIMYTATMIAGHVAKQVKDVVTKKPYARTTHWDIAQNNQLTWAKGDSNVTR